MKVLRKIVSIEPILFSRLIASVAAVAIAYGAPITDTDVNNAVQTTTTLFALGNMVLALLDRQAVYSPATHDEDVSEAFAVGVEAGTGLEAGRAEL